MLLLLPARGCCRHSEPIRALSPLELLAMPSLVIASVPTGCKRLVMDLKKSKKGKGKSKTAGSESSSFCFFGPPVSDRNRA